MATFVRTAYHQMKLLELEKENKRLRKTNAACKRGKRPERSEGPKGGTNMTTDLTALLAENSRLKEQVQQLQDRRDRMYDDMLLWRGIDREGGDAPCEMCGGAGVRVYSDTTTWRGGVGGQMITSDICDKCWGSGNAERPWLNLRRLPR